MRSLASIIVNRVIARTPRKKGLTEPKLFNKRIEELIAQGEITYQLNYKGFTVDVKKASLNGMDYYILNSNKKENKNKILYFHGGGFISQPVKEHWKFLNRISKDTKTEIWVPIYPKIPYHNADDSYKLLMELYKIFADSVNEGKIIFMGDSAGGSLVLGMAQQIKAVNMNQPSELIMISPLLDAAVSSPEIKEIEPKDVMLGSYGTRKCAEMWAGDKNINDPIVSPLYGDIIGLGRMTIFTGTHDIINPDSHRLLEKAQRQQISINFNEKKYMQHVYPLLPIPEAKEAIRKIEAIVDLQPID